MPSCPKPKKRKKSQLRLARDKADELISAYVKDRDNHTCQVCGGAKCGAYPDGPGILDHHHIFGRSPEYRYYAPGIASSGRGCHFHLGKSQSANNRFAFTWMGEDKYLEAMKRGQIDIDIKDAVEEALMWLVPWSKAA